MSVLCLLLVCCWADAGHTQPDLEPSSPDGWAGPIVPRHLPDATIDSVPHPEVLQGWSQATYLNAATGNASPIGLFAAVANQVLLDGVPLHSIPEPGYGPFEVQVVMNSEPHYVRGGRHTLSLSSDHPDDHEEISEANNRSGVQYGWSGMPLPPGPTLDQPAPPNPYGGWGDLAAAEPSMNSNGYRTPVFTPGVSFQGTWAAVASAPGDISDVNLLLHEVVDDPRLAYDAILAESMERGNRIDYVLMDLANSNPLQYDIGVTRGSGEQDYHLHVATSTPMGLDPTDTFGFWELGPNELIGVHGLELSASYLRIHLRNLSDTADLDFAMHAANGNHQGPDDALDAGAFVTRGPGGDESMILDIANPGRYVIVVRKSSSADVAQTAAYKFEFFTVTDAPDSPAPRRTGFASIHPNPFNPRTTIQFDLQRRGSVRVEIHNARGTLVRRLVQEVRPAGRHELVWDGIDETGRSVASGVYHVRLIADRVEDRRKLTLIK